MLITERLLLKKTGVYGDRNDPTQYEDIKVRLNGTEFKLHLGLGVRFYIDGHEIPLTAPDWKAREAEATDMWQVATGMSVEQFFNAYERLNPPSDDPMGCASDYE